MAKQGWLNMKENLLLYTKMIMENFMQLTLCALMLNVWWIGIVPKKAGIALATVLAFLMMVHYSPVLPGEA